MGARITWFGGKVEGLTSAVVLWLRGAGLRPRALVSRRAFGPAFGFVTRARAFGTGVVLLGAGLRPAGPAGEETDAAARAEAGQ